MGNTGRPVTNTSVAIHDENNHGLRKGDSILLVAHGSGAGTVKTVDDRCPGCADGHIDNYDSTVTDCNPNHTNHLGDFVTIKLID